VHSRPKQHQRYAHGKHIPEDELDWMSIFRADTDSLSILVVQLMDMLIEERGMHQPMRGSENNILKNYAEVILPDESPDGWEVVPPEGVHYFVIIHHHAEEEQRRDDDQVVKDNYTNCLVKNSAPCLWILLPWPEL
jgi:hypothetical protein